VRQSQADKLPTPAAGILKGDSYRLRGKDLDARIAAKHAEIG